MLEEKEYERNNKAIVGMVLGIVGLFIPVIGLALGIIGIVFSALALKEIREFKQIGKGIAISGLATSIVAVVIHGSLVLMMILIYGIVTSIVSFFESIF